MCRIDVEFNDEDIIALAESYMAQLEHPKMVRKGLNKFWLKTWAQKV